MSTSRTSARLPRRLARRGDAGFTLMEVMVALALLALVSVALVPLLVAGARASGFANLTTVAKNLAAQRLEQMRNLPYHVAYQNGPFVDLLDEYFTNISTAPTSVTPTGGTGVYVANGTGAGGAPTGPFYQVSFPSVPGFADGSTSIPGFTGFSQTVDTQFLVANTSPPTAVTPPAGYDSQATGVDSPASGLVGVTVFTSFTALGQPHVLRVYTEITDLGVDNPLVVDQAGAVALHLTATAFDGSTLTAELGGVGINGTLSTTSVAQAQADPASFTQVDPAGDTANGCGSGVETCAQSSAGGAAVAPPSPAGTAGMVTDPNQHQTDSLESPCGWGAFGPTFAGDVTAADANAQPMAPSDVESGASPTPTVSSGLSPHTSGACSGLYFTNILAGSPAPADGLGLAPGQPVVAIPNATGSDNVVTSTGYADTPALPFSGSRSPVTSAASIAYTQPVQLFPGLAIVGDGGPLVTLQVASARLSCSSTSEDATASYTGTLTYWSQPSPTTPGSRVGVSLDWASGQPAPGLPAPSSITVGYRDGVAVPLSAYLASWSLAGTVVQQTSGSSGVSVGTHTIPDVFTATTTAIVPSAETYGTETAVQVGVGQLSCAAEDNR